MRRLCQRVDQYITNRWHDTLDFCTLVCPASYLANLSPYVFIAPEYDVIRARVTNARRPVVDSQEFTDMRGNVLYRVEVWDLSRNLDALELYRPDDFWIQRVIMKTNVAAGAQFL